jgi:hypothetical protein
MPVSGALKTSFPLVTPIHIQSWLDTWAHPRQFNLFVVQREASLVLPALFALAYLALTLRITLIGPSLVLRYRASTHDYDRFLTPTAVGILPLAAYDILYVADGPGSWYVPVSTLFVSLAVIAVADRGQRAVTPTAARLWLGGIALASVAFFVKLHRQIEYHHMYADCFFRDAPSVHRQFAGRPPKFVEMDDGIVSYALDVPAMSAGLALDPEGLDAARGNTLFPVAYERGFKCISSLVYLSAQPLLTDASPAAAERYVQGRFADQNISGFDFDVAFVAPSGALAIVCGQKR